MKKEIRIFFTAVMFLTRLPVPKYTDHSPEYLQHSLKYSPLVGWIIGAVSWIGFFAFSYINGDIAVLASIIAGILATGAFHEDGFADVCDAFGGGWTKEKILLIMKDSRLGTYGAIGIIAMLASKFMLLKYLLVSIPPVPPHTWSYYAYVLLLCIAAHAASRLMPVLVVRFFDYVTDPDGSKSKPIASKKPSVAMCIIAAVFALIPVAVCSPAYTIVVIPMLLIGYLFARYFKKWIGGYTGDCLGAVQQVSEIVFYLGIIIIQQYV